MKFKRVTYIRPQGSLAELESVDVIYRVIGNNLRMALRKEDVINILEIDKGRFIYLVSSSRDYLTTHSTYTEKYIGKYELLR